MAEKRTEFESLGGNNLDGIGGNAKKITYTAEDGTKKSIQIDCGMKFSDKALTGVDNYIAPLECDDLLLTHAHADHIAGIIHHIQMNPERPLNKSGNRTRCPTPRTVLQQERSERNAF